MTRVSATALGVCTAVSLVTAPTGAEPNIDDPSVTMRADARASFSFGRIARLRNFTHQWADVRIAPNGKFALVAVDSYLQRVKLTRGKMRVTGTNKSVHGSIVAIAPNSHLAYVVDEPPPLVDQRLRVVKVDRPRPKIVATRKNKAFVPKDDAYDIEVSRNGRWLYVKVHRSIKVFSLAKPRKPRLVRKVKAPESRGELSMTRDGKRLISLTSTGRDRYTVYSLAKQARPRKLTTKRLGIGDVFTLATNRASGRAYAISDSDKAIGQNTRYVRFSARNGRKQQRFVLNRYQSATDAAIWPDGRFMFVVTLGGDERPGGVINTRTMKPLADLRGVDYPRAVSISNNGPSQGRAYVIARRNSNGNRVLVEIERR